MWFFVRGQWVFQAPAGDDGAEGGSADTEVSSEGESEYSELVSELEDDSYDEEVDEGQDEEETKKSAADDSADKSSADDSVAEDEESDESETDEDEGQDDASDKSETEDKDEETADDEAKEETPEPMTSEQMEAARNEYIDSIAGQFEFSEEEVDALRTEPEKVLPKMLARVQTQALEQAVQIMRQNLPQMVGAQLTQQSAAQEIEQKFFGKYPELKSPKAQKVAEKAASAYRQANPDAPLDDIMDSVAFMTWKALGLPMDKLSKRMNLSSDEEFVSAGTQRKNKGAYKPAGAGKTGTQETRAKEETANPFDEMIKLMEDDSYFDED